MCGFICSFTLLAIPPSKKYMIFLSSFILIHGYIVLFCENFKTCIWELCYCYVNEIYWLNGRMSCALISIYYNNLIFMSVTGSKPKQDLTKLGLKSTNKGAQILV